MSHITTHILDTSIGRPAEGVALHLESFDGHEWDNISSGITNSDGRVSDLLPDGILLEPGVYRMRFETGKYYQSIDVQTFYPEVSVVFEVFDGSHYHVPLLLNPFGYSTYRGS